MVTPSSHAPLHTSRGTFIYSPLQDKFAKYFTILIFTYETNRNQKGSKLSVDPKHFINGRTGVSNQIFFILKLVPLLIFILERLQ